MHTDTAPIGSSDTGATVVITHRVREDRHADYDRWLVEVGSLCTSSTGNLDWHVIRPIQGLTSTYTIVIRFDTKANLQTWMASPIRSQLIEKVKPLLVSGDDFFISSGLDFWFTPEGAKAKVPARWRQYLVTWSAIYPLVLGMSLIVSPVLRMLGVSSNHLLTTFIVTGAVVFLMIYVVMPHYTKLVRRWLFS
jgi:antibiotic biosynthesis monooxygenase (ABM) superfamily enzyme